MVEEKYFVITSDKEDLGGANYYFISLKNNEDSFELLKKLEVRYAEVYDTVYTESQVALFLEILLRVKDINEYPFLYKDIVLKLPISLEEIRKELYETTIEDFINNFTIKSYDFV